MDTTELRGAYRTLLDAAATPDLGVASDGGWDADHILAHVLSVDAGIAAVALAGLSGSRPTYDNRISVDAWNLNRIISEHQGRQHLIDHVQRQGVLVCDLGEQLSDADAAIVVPVLIVSNDVVTLDQPIPLAGLLDGLAQSHLPLHAQQLLDLRVDSTQAAR